MNKAVQELQKLKHNQFLMYLLVFSLVTITIWVGISLFLSQKTDQVDPDLQKLALPLSPTIDTKAIDTIEQNQEFPLESLSNFPIYMSVTRKIGEAPELTTLQAEKILELKKAAPTPNPTLTPVLIPQGIPISAPASSASQAAPAPVAAPPLVPEDQLFTVTP